MYNKLLKCLLIVTVTIVLILNIQWILDTIISNNLNISQGHFFYLWVLFFIEISIGLIFYDFLMSKIYVWISSSLETLCRLTIKRKHIGIAQFIIRIDYNLIRIFRFFRLGWIRYGSSDISPVWIGISKSTLFQKIIFIARIVISLPALLSIILTLFTLDIINVDWLHGRWQDFLDFFKRALAIKINFGDIFSKLPAVVALLTILPALFFFYFYSQKREVRKVIDEINRESFEIVVIKHNELSKLISKSIYTISENLDYVINCQSLIINLILSKMIKNIHELEDRYYYPVRSVETYLFKEIPEIQKIAELIAELTTEELDYFTRLFSVKRYEIWHFYFEFNSCKTSEKLNRLFLTKQGMEKMISKVTELSSELSEEDLTKYRKEQQDTLSYNIYDALEMLYALKRYNDSVKRYLNSSKVEKTLMKTLAKEK